MQENQISQVVLDSAIQIHKALGPGLLESVYEATLAYELTKRGLKVITQQGLPVIYEKVKLDLGFRIDLIAQDKVIVEIKSVETLAPVHRKQVLTYLRLANMKLGLLINFNVEKVVDGYHRIVNNL